MYRRLRYSPELKKRLRPKIKFNGGRGAIVCRRCGKILKQNLSLREWFGIRVEIFCLSCAIEMIVKIFKNASNELQRKKETERAVSREN